MLRRRIFSSAMASVMALSSVAVVANAEETASAVKSKADLEAYVNSFDSFRSNELYDYGSISGENFLNALEYADNVLADDESSEDDYTVAYAMIEAVYNSLTIYTVEELKALVASCTGIYETNNIYNEELGDARYDADSFSTFEGAYEEADSVLDSNDSRIITDAYEQLEAAKKNLAPLTAVSKSQFRSAIKAYEAALQTEWDYDTWRVGTIDTGWAYWGYQGQTVAFGTLYDHAASLEGTINTAYEELDEIKALNKTTAPNLVDAYNACVAATTVLKGFTPDDTNRATKANVKSLLNQYHGRLVYDYNSTSAEELYEKVLDVVGEDNITVLQSLNEAGSTDYFAADEVTDPFCIDDASYTVDPNGGIHKGSVTKLISAELTIKSTVAYYICLDDDGFWNGTVSLTKPVDGKYKLITFMAESLSEKDTPQSDKKHLLATYSHTIFKPVVPVKELRLLVRHIKFLLLLHHLCHLHNNPNLTVLQFPLQESYKLRQRVLLYPTLLGAVSHLKHNSCAILLKDRGCLSDCSGKSRVLVLGAGHLLPCSRKFLHCYSFMGCNNLLLGGLGCTLCLFDYTAYGDSSCSFLYRACRLYGICFIG